MVFLISGRAFLAADWEMFCCVNGTDLSGNCRAAQRVMCSQPSCDMLPIIHNVTDWHRSWALSTGWVQLSAAPGMCPGRAGRLQLSQTWSSFTFTCHKLSLWQLKLNKLL